MDEESDRVGFDDLEQYVLVEKEQSEDEVLVGYEEPESLAIAKAEQRIKSSPEAYERLDGNLVALGRRLSDLKGVVGGEGEPQIEKHESQVGHRAVLSLTIHGPSWWQSPEMRARYRAAQDGYGELKGSRPRLDHELEEEIALEEAYRAERKTFGATRTAHKAQRQYWAQQRQSMAAARAGQQQTSHLSSTQSFARCSGSRFPPCNPVNPDAQSQMVEEAYPLLLKEKKNEGNNRTSDRSR